jgi:hypothetical protein
MHPLVRVRIDQPPSLADHGVVLVFTALIQLATVIVESFARRVERQPQPSGRADASAESNNTPESTSAV